MRGRGEGLGACPNTTGRGARRTPATGGQLHFSRNLRENANARGIWQQWPWSVAPILRVGFLVDVGSRLGRVVGGEGRQREKGKERGRGTQRARRRNTGEGWSRGGRGGSTGELCRPCKAEAQSGSSSNPRRPTSAIYWLSQPPDKGGQPRSIRGLPTHLPIRPLPPSTFPTHPPLTPLPHGILHEASAHILIRNTAG